jgi:hypothetical protein
MLPPTTREAFLDAMTRFDQEMRNELDWQDWEQDPHHRYAINWNGRHYPVKQIASMAAGVPRNAFSGGNEANGYVHRYGLETVPVRRTPARVSSVWWVNQGATYEQERHGGYLWAPLKDQRGAALAHWESLAKVSRGDVIVHYLDGAVRALSLATSEAELMPRPAEFGSTPWAEEGRRLLVTYYELGSPIPKSAIAEQVRALQIPYGPIAEGGRVKQGYLWHFSLDGLRLVRASSGEVWPDWATAVLEAVPPTAGTNVVPDSVVPEVEAPLVFVSHSHKDEDFTKQLVTDLRRAGADVWVDMTDVTHDDFVKRINAGLKGREWFILVMTPAALQSDWVQLEVNAAIGLVMQKKMRSIIPVVARPCDLDDIPPLWAAYHRYDATHNYSAALAHLLQVLGLSA